MLDQSSTQTPYKISNNTRVRLGNKCALVWHRLWGTPQVVPRHIGSEILAGRVARLDPDVLSLFRRLHLVETRVSASDKRFYAAIDSGLRTLRGLANLKSVMVVLTSGCNLGCPHCMFRSAAPFRPVRANYRVTRSQLLHLIGDNKWTEDRPLSVAFTGGEPLLEWTLFKKLVVFLRTIQTPISLRVLTNGTLITPEKATFLKAYHVAVHLSVDGVGKVFSRTRPIKGGGDGSFAAFQKGALALRQAGVVIASVQCTLSIRNLNDDHKSTMQFVRDQLGLDQMSFELDLTAGNELGSPVHVARRLCKLIDIGKDLGVEVSGFWSRPYMAMFEKVRKKSRWSFCGAPLGSGLTITSWESWKVCPYLDSELGPATMAFGEIAAAWERWAEQQRSNQRERCKGCELEAFCMGGCQVSELHAGASKYRCDVYIAVFNRLVDRTAKEEMCR